MNVMKILKLNVRIKQIKQIFEFHWRILKNHENHKIPNENHKNHEHHRIECDNNEKMKTIAFH